MQGKLVEECNRFIGRSVVQAIPRYRSGKTCGAVYCPLLVINEVCGVAQHLKRCLSTTQAR